MTGDGGRAAEGGRGALAVCRAAGLLGLAAGLTVIVANAPDRSTATLAEAVRARPDVVACAFAVLAATGGFVSLCVRFPGVFVGLAFAFAAVLWVWIASVCLIGWARLLGFSPMDLPPSDTPGTALGFLIVGLAITALSWCLAPFRDFEKTGPNQSRDDFKYLAAWTAAALLVVCPGVVSWKESQLSVNSRAFVDGR